MESDTDALLEAGKAILRAQPFSNLLGAELVRLTETEAELRLVINDDLRQQHGFAHGGVVAYLADNALSYAGSRALTVDVVTAEFKINFIRPATGRALIARAKCLRSGKSSAVVRCDVFSLDEDEKLCAAAQGTISRISGRDQ